MMKIMRVSKNGKQTAIAAWMVGKGNGYSIATKLRRINRIYPRRRQEYNTMATFRLRFVTLQSVLNIVSTSSQN